MQLVSSIELPPIEILAKAVLDYVDSDDARVRIAQRLFDPYDGFLGLLDDQEKRSLLESIPPDAADSSAVFLEAKELGTRFQAGLIDLFFNSDDKLARHMKEYGIF